MESSLETSSTSSSSLLSEAIFNGETFSCGNGEEIAVEPLEMLSDGKDENCKKCQ